jgi:transposase
MIVPQSGARVWLATGATDMRRGMNSLALQVQELLHRDPHLCVGREVVPRCHCGPVCAQIANR